VDQKTPPPENPDEKVSLATWASIAIGTTGFVMVAFSDPVFDNLLLDIPLYLAVGLAGVVLFYATFWLTGIAVGREKVLRNGRVSGVGWSLGALSFIVSVGAAVTAMTLLQQAH
jgi:predicted membrane channel-forming protein YqfA (hemolysin III family)